MSRAVWKEGETIEEAATGHTQAPKHTSQAPALARALVSTQEML